MNKPKYLTGVEYLEAIIADKDRYIARLEAELQECREKSGTYIDLGKVPYKKRPNLVIGP